MIDFTNVNTLRIRLKSAKTNTGSYYGGWTSNAFSFLVADSIYNGYPATKLYDILITYGGLSVQEIDVDISNISGSKYLCMYFCNNGTTTVEIESLSLL